MAGEIKHRTIAANGIRMHVAEQGEGPLVLFCHGWPELWYSWRHQLPAVAAAGFRAVAPDMRGYGQTDAPSDIRAYSIFHLVGDVVALVEALGEKKAIIVGHDWGAPVAWTSAMLRPDVFRAVVAMSVPHRQRGPAPPLAILGKNGLNTFYWIYFQEPGVAEAEFENDVHSTMRRIIYGGSGDARGSKLSMVLEPGKGFLANSINPEQLPDWITEADIAFMAGEFQRTGFRGGLNWYRNIDSNWELMAPWQGATIQQPALFIAGTRDGVIRGPIGEGAVEKLPQVVPGLKRTLLIDGAGHWIQQERPAQVNAALLEFLSEFKSA
jgi:pimeloyl-ACP methyl ester carboxylesterase